jgi:hypothetical protein
MGTRDISNQQGTQRGNHSKKGYAQKPLEAKAQAPSPKEKKKDFPIIAKVCQ